MKKILFFTAITIAISTLITGCSNPKNVDIKLKKEKITKKQTNYTASLDIFGRMTEIYASRSTRIQSKGVTDDTGTAQSTGGEIPIDITEMIKTAINKIGGKVQYIDYDPSHMSNMRALGYSSFNNKIIPTLVVSGGITEYDRSLDVRGSGSDFGGEGTFQGQKIGLDMGDSEKESRSNITIDISLIDFQTWAMIPKMSSTNTVSVYSGMASSEIGFSIAAVTFGLNGNVKKVQGRHAAVRLLVELSVIEVVGRYLDLPYWKVLPNGKEDKVVIRSISKKFMRANDEDRIAMIQNALYLHGYDADMTGKLDAATKAAVDKYKNKSGSKVAGYNTLALFKELYVNVPLENNFRSTKVFFTPSVQKSLSKVTGLVKSPSPQAKTKALTAPKKSSAPKPKVKVLAKSLPKAKPIIAKGVFRSKNETMAVNMATNMAINSLAKRLGKVVQSEYSSFINEDIMMKITTNAKNIVSGYEVISEKYNYKTGKAVVEIKLDGEVIEAEVQKQLQQ